MLQSCSTLVPYFGQIPNPENTLPDPVVRINDRRLTTVKAGEVRNVIFVKNNDVDDLIAELPRYVAAVDRSDVDVDTLELWTRH